MVMPAFIQLHGTSKMANVLQARVVMVCGMYHIVVSLDIRFGNSGFCNNVA
jgi:hypothetical protein